MQAAATSPKAAGIFRTRPCKLNPTILVATVNLKCIIALSQAGRQPRRTVTRKAVLDEFGHFRVGTKNHGEEMGRSMSLPFCYAKASNSSNGGPTARSARQFERVKSCAPAISHRLFPGQYFLTKLTA